MLKKNDSTLVSLKILSTKFTLTMNDKVCQIVISEPCKTDFNPLPTNDKEGSTTRYRKEINILQ